MPDATVEPKLAQILDGLLLSIDIERMDGLFADFVRLTNDKENVSALDADILLMRMQVIWLDLEPRLDRQDLVYSFDWDRGRFLVGIGNTNHGKVH